MANRFTALAVAALATTAATGLFADWVYASGVGEQNTISGISTWLIWAPVVLGSFLLLAGGLLWQLDRVGPARALHAGGSVVLLIPASIVVVVTEMVQAWLPTWLAPVLTNSDAFAFRAGIGAWIALVVAIGGLVTAAIGFPQRGASSEAEGLSGYIALVATLVGASGLMVLRARPFAQVDLTVQDGVVEQVASGAAGLPSEVPSMVTDILGDSVGGATTVNLVAGDIPLFGQVTLLATIALIVALVLLLLRPGLGSLIAAGAATGTLTMSGWLLSAIVVTIDTVIPKSWLAVDGYAAVEAGMTTSIWWLAFWSMIVTVGLAGVALGLGAPRQIDDEVASDESDGAPVYDWGSSKWPG